MPRGFNLCPHVKKEMITAGEYVFDSLQVFPVGEWNLFARALHVFIPDLSVREVRQEEANVAISVSYIYSPCQEYCYIRITARGLEIHCRDNGGARNAASILAQIIQTKNDGTYSIPCGTIEDWPDTAYRAMMLESSGRVWMPMNELRRYIQEMALCRMNVLQFHFMEQNGCTIPLDTVPDFWGSGEENHKFTKEEVREMVAFAGELGITVTPFVEVLSHAYEFAQKAGIQCPGDGGDSIFDVCLGQEKTFAVIEKVLTEIAELFPDEVIHIGADEYDMRLVSPLKPYWDQCPHCQALSDKMGYTTLRELFMYGIGRINQIVNRLGKVMMIWNADIRPGHLPEDMERNVIIHYYRDNNIFGKERHYNLNINGYIEDGFSVINSYYLQTYMDFSRYMSAEKLNGWSPVSDPLVKKYNRAKLPGGCCCAWESHEHFCRTIPAAIILFADRLWNAKEDPSAYDDEYGKRMTKVLFGELLPEDVNVFACLGGVLPPLEDGVAAHVDRVEIGLDELNRTYSLLSSLAGKGNELAAIYAEAVYDVIRKKSEGEKKIESPKERQQIDG